MDKDAKSSFKYIFGKIFRSLNPLQYRQLKNEGMKSSLVFLFQALLIAYIIGMIIFAPVILNLPVKINKELEKINSIDLNINMNNNESIVIGNSKFILGDELYYKKGICLLYNPLCRNDTGSMQYSTAAEKEKLESKIRFLFVMALPFIIVGSFIFNYFRFLLFAIIAALIVFLIAKIIKKSLGISETFNVAAHSLVLLIIFETIITPLSISLGFIPLIIYASFCIVNFIMIIRDQEQIQDK